MVDIVIKGNETVKGTIKDFQGLFQIEDGTTVNGFVKFLEARGLAKAVGKQGTPTGRGKPSTIWEIPSSFSVTIIPGKTEKQVEKVVEKVEEQVEKAEKTDEQAA